MLRTCPRRVETIRLQLDNRFVNIDIIRRCVSCISSQHTMNTLLPAINRFTSPQGDVISSTAQHITGLFCPVSLDWDNMTIDEHVWSFCVTVNILVTSTEVWQDDFCNFCLWADVLHCDIHRDLTRSNEPYLRCSQKIYMLV